MSRALVVLGRRQGRAFWRFFTSVRLALVLILFLGFLTLIGTLVVQTPSDALADPEEYAWWLDNVERESGVPSVKQQAASLSSLAVQTAEGIRDLALDLRPAALDELGLVPALQNHVRDLSKRGGHPH